MALGRPGAALVCFAAGGALASSAVVVAGGRVGPVAGTTPLSSWFGLLRSSPVDAQANVFPGVALVLSIGALALVWVLALRRSARWSTPQLWVLATCWVAPLALGPPLLSDDLSSYVAQGELSLRDLSPYVLTPAQLHAGQALAAVDPLWRNTHSPYGPLFTLIEHVAAYLAGGSPLGTAILLRAVALVSLFAIGILAHRLAPPQWRNSALLLTVLNPLLLLHLGSAAHADGIVCVLTLGAILALRRGHFLTAMGLACADGLTKAPGFVLAMVVLVLIWKATDPPRRGVVLLRVCVVVAATTAALSASVSDGWGWLGQLGTPAFGFTPAAPATALALAFHPALVWTHVMSAGALTWASRAVVVAIGLVFVIHLLRTSSRREPARTAGFILLAVALLSPVIYPWYLLWGVTCLAVSEGRRLRLLLVSLSIVGSLMAVQGLTYSGIAVVASLLVTLISATVFVVGRMNRERRKVAVPLLADVS
ncbi:MAG: polyprenol phosphomannose-dependent alpha 1,6 mannosyltransferase MptB [Actinomycetota bacterium]|nr:polyprenol phosphomannose-dependent alpha 1,6 mannosyltransferase MptB [Actinomycetota bacterium]